MKFVVRGGRKLSGAIEVGGSKNAATPIIAATILTTRPCVIHNIPHIGDVVTMLAILESMGSQVQWVGSHSIRVANSNIDPTKMDTHLVHKIRSSVLLIGPLLARFGKIEISTPGGCHIGLRPLDAHLNALRELGASVQYDVKKDLYSIAKPRSGKWGSVTTLNEFSVTATENLMMLGGGIGALTIMLAAAEPHVQDVGRFLTKLGLHVSGFGTHTVAIRGKVRSGSPKKEIVHSIISDPIEAGTFIILGAATRSRISVNRINPEFLTAPLQKLKEFGVQFRVERNRCVVRGDESFLRAARVQTLPYPGLPTDLQAPFGVLAARSRGETLIFDTLYEGRLKYLRELQKMGAQARILDPHRAVVIGPTKLHGARIKSLDLRAGATLVIAALIAEGISVLSGIEQIDRGYEHLEKRLQKLGADIRRTE